MSTSKGSHITVDLHELLRARDAADARLMAAIDEQGAAEQAVEKAEGALLDALKHMPGQCAVIGRTLAIVMPCSDSSGELLAFVDNVVILPGEPS